MSKLQELMDRVVLAALQLQVSRMWLDRFPGVAHGADNVEMAEERLDNAIGEYQSERERLTHK